MNNSEPSYSPWEQEIIALAAVAQCAAIVDKLATKGYADPHQLAASINPLMVLEPPSFSDVYPNLTGLSLGFRTLQNVFSNTRPNSDSAVLRYALGLLHIRGSLERNNPMLEQIGSTLPNIALMSGADATHRPDKAEGLGESERTEAFEARFIEGGAGISQGDKLIIKQLAGLYQDTISTLRYRIQVQGKAEHLKNDDVANSIRAVLLSGIRSAVLWRQMGGRRWRLLVYRKRICDTAMDIRKKLIH